jgi:uncharacterized protein (DUF1330 family)
MKTINPTAEDFSEALEHIPADTPIVMLNLLRYKEWADYGDGQQTVSGREAYQRYISGATISVAEYGAEIIWSGSAKSCIIAPAQENWDGVLLVRYPSIKAFAEMSQSPGLADFMVHRTAGLDDTRLIATVEGAY